MFKWLKKLFENPVPESTPAPSPTLLMWVDECIEASKDFVDEDKELIDAYNELVKKYGFIEFEGRPTAWDDTITDEQLYYSTIVNGWYVQEGQIAIRAHISEIIEYWDRLLSAQKEKGFNVIVWRRRPMVHKADSENPYRVRLRCAFTTKDKVKPHLLTSKQCAIT